MVYKKSFRRKRVFRKKRAYRKSRVKKTVTRMLVARGLNRPELKHSLTQNEAIATSLNFDSSNPGVPLTDMNQGTDSNEFIGKEVRGKYLHIRGSVYSQNTTDSLQVRLIVVEDMSPLNALILNASGTSQGYEILQFNTIDAVTNYIGRGIRFKILKDRIFNLPPKATATNVQTYSYRFPLGNARFSTSPGLVSGDYALNRRILAFWVSETAGSYWWMHVDFAYTDV